MSVSTADQAVHELVNIEWRERLDKTRSHIALMEEFLRRAALWAQALNAGKEWPFFDIAQRVNPDKRANALLCAQLDEHVQKHQISLFMRRCLINHLHWLELSEGDLQARSLSLLPAPYEPIVVMFKRGGSFWLDSIAIIIGVTSVWRKPLAEYAGSPALLDLTEASLDAWDGSVAGTPSTV
ncbi:MAG TPA: hypothetical protein VFS21_34415 [Roseiflexaceae bacterium]|nr:hypothetical protein [Roseiflexaceae bacterium]